MAEAKAAKPLTRRQKNVAMTGQLKSERASFEPHWRELSDFYLPRRSRWYTSDANKGDRRNQRIIDSTPTFAARTLRSGMMAGITSPARPWFRLTLPDPDLAEIGQNKEWLHTVTQRMRTVLDRSNVYKVLSIIYGDLGVFGTAAMLIEEDFETVVRCESFPIGSYWAGLDARGKVGIFYREFRMTVRQLVEKFGRDEASGPIQWARFSEKVKTSYENAGSEEWIDVGHLICPNDQHDPNKIEAKFKKFHSCYYELGTQGDKPYLASGIDDDRYLRESGFDRFPVLLPRWETTGEDVYGTDCPGMTGLGDDKGLQLLQRRKAQAVEKMVMPPLTGGTHLRNVKVSLLPGDVTYNDEREGQKGLRPIHEVNAPLQYMIEDVREHQERIDRAFFVDLFLMLARTDRREITATEVEERKEEKLIALGPVLEQLNDDLLNPLIDIIFDYMVAQDLIPQPPEDLDGIDLRVEYVSIMAQAQKLVGLSGLRELFALATQVVQVTQDPASIDKIDFDQGFDEAGEMLGVSPRVIRSDDKVEELRAGRAKAQKAAATMETIREGAGAAKDLAAADMGGDNALSRMVEGAKQQTAQA